MKGWARLVFMLCFGWWLGLIYIIFGILFRFSFIFAPIGTKLMNQGFKIMRGDI